MNINKYLIAAMITVGVMKGVSAQDNNNKKTIHSLQSTKKHGPDAWVINSAKQTQAMKTELALNDVQLKEVKKINESHAKEIETARVECGDDVTGFNSYVDRVAYARDRELKSVLTADQFASYTAKKDDKNWLGLANFKYKSEDGDLKVKNEKKELKIKGQNKAAVAGEDLSAKNKSNTMPDMSNDAVNNNNNIILDTVAITEGVVIDSGASGSVPEIKTFPGGMDTSSDQAKLNERVKSEYDNMYSEKVKPEYNGMYADSISKKDCEAMSKKASKSGSTHKKATVSSKSKTTSKAGTKSTKSKTTVKAPSKSKNNASASKSSTKKTATAKSGTMKKKKKTTESATVKKKAKVDTINNFGSVKAAPVIPDTVSSSEMPMQVDTTVMFGVPMDTTARMDEFMPDTTATIIIIPDTAGMVDTTSSASTKSPNYFNDKNSKAKFSDGESKIKPSNSNKMKETDSQSKSKDENNKVKEEKNQTKVKDGNLKIKVDK